MKSTNAKLFTTDVTKNILEEIKRSKEAQTKASMENWLHRRAVSAAKAGRREISAKVWASHVNVIDLLAKKLGMRVSYSKQAYKKALKFGGPQNQKPFRVEITLRFK